MRKYRKLGMLMCNAYKNIMIYHSFYAFIPVNPNKINKITLK